MQKLAYLYGWQTFFEECDDVDDETLYEMVVLLGVMMGVGSANSMLTVIAKNAQEAVAKKVARQSLTKTSWYPILKKLLSFMDIKITKQTVGGCRWQGCCGRRWRNLWCYHLYGSFKGVGALV